MPIWTKRLMLSIVGISMSRRSVARECGAVFLEELGYIRARNGNSRTARNGRYFSPIEAPEPGNKIKMLVPAYKREGMLAAERGDPQIVGGNRLAFPFQLKADGRIGVSGPIVNVEHPHRSDPLAKPALIAGPVPGLRDSKPIFA